VPASPSTEAAETRMRATPRVEAQQPVRASAPPESTVIRHRPEEAVAEPDAVRKPKRRGRGVLIGVLVGLVATAAVVVAVVWGSSVVGPPESEPTEVAVDDGGPIVAGGVPTPIDGAVSADATGTAYTFTWANPDPQDGDQFIWLRTDGAGDDARHPTTEPTALVEGVPAGTNVCIDVSLVRSNGEESGVPLTVCVR
jgi:hypothetical protein